MYCTRGGYAYVQLYTAVHTTKFSTIQLYNYESGNSRGKSLFFVVIFKKGVPNIGVNLGSAVALLPGTLARALVVLHNTLPTGHENSHDGLAHRREDDL